MQTANRFVSIVVSVLCCLLLGACAESQQSSPEPLPEVTIGVVGFSQPGSVLELMAGYLPEDQGLVPEEDLRGLDEDLRSALDATKRPYTFIAHLPQPEKPSGSERQKGGNSALSYWVNVAKQSGVDVLIVPFVIDWHERQGGDMGVATSAAVMIDIFLVDAHDEGNLLQRSSFNEKQTGLSNNFLNLGTFFKRGGKWLTARQLTQEAIQKAIAEFGL